MIGKNLKDNVRRLEAGDNNGQIETQIQIITAANPCQVQFQKAPPPLAPKNEEMTMDHGRVGMVTSCKIISLWTWT